MFGYCQVLRSDNGPPFQSHAFKEYAEHAGFKHRKITPLHPMGNPIAESFMKPLSKAIKSAAISGNSVKDEITSFLLNYRNAPHSTTQLSPAEIMFGRKLNTKLPKFTAKVKDKYIRQRDKSVKMKNKKYADKTRHAQHRDVKIGDKVLLRRENYTKNQTPYHPIPGEVVKRKGSAVTINLNGKLITRDISKFKEFHGQMKDVNKEESSPTYTGLRRSQRPRRTKVPFDI
ncbi:uncharacterized protein K02A2.6-like [Mercenaria mercenaria]|uniref:uncharacterized protein K02A2.6-like n=1 Tax=Mercenaria mercenaria TaxID=6596 RepID=UPI00234F79D3|nr:uncharacterized protein K02A2.6-like [Mercenaria mercenaria]